MPKHSNTASVPCSFLGWLPAGLWAGGALALVRGRAHHSALSRVLGDLSQPERDLLDWDSGFAVASALPWCVLAGVAAAWIVSRVTASSSRHVARSLVARSLVARNLVARSLVARSLVAAAALVLLAAVAAPLAPDRLRAGWHASLTWDSLLLLAPLAVCGALALLLGTLRVARLAEAGRRGTILSGPLAAVAALVFGVLGPANIARLQISRTPTFERRMAVIDLLARPDLRSVLEGRTDRPPAVQVLTPTVDQHSDSADKPALIMPPPCRVEVRLPEDASDGVLRAAAALDRVLRNQLPEGVDHATVDFSISRNGEEVFRTRIRSERPAPGVWDPSDWIWRHAGGAEGIPVQGGDRLVFETSIPEGDPAETLDPKLLTVGFGGMVIEARRETRRSRATPDAPNLVLVVMDTLRADRLSCYGYSKATSPNLDALAARGVRFSDAYSTSSWTWPSTASILTGLPADAHGVTKNESCTLNLALTSLPEVLQARGYTTAAFSGNPLIAPERYFDQGFESFESSGRRMRNSDEVVPSVLRWLDGHAGARFFLYLHLTDPHTPHDPRPELLAQLGGERPADFPEAGLDAFHSERLQVLRQTGALPPVRPDQEAWVQDVYDASVATGDYWLGQVLQRLEDLGLDDRTVVLFTADHGEELLDRGRLGHGHGIHAELVRVPLVMAGPGIPRGVVDSGMVSNRHVAPTLAHLGGAELPGMGDGRLLGLESGEAEPGSVFFQTTKGQWRGRNYQQLFGLRSGDRVLHWVDAEGGGQLSLFDTTLDPRELQDLSSSEPEAAQELLRELRERLVDQRKWAPAHVIGVGAGGMEALYAIGYADREGAQGDEQDERDE